MTNTRSPNAKSLLAPVPLLHLRAAISVVNEHGKVAFGSNSIDLFEKMESEMIGDVYIYASHSQAEDESGRNEQFWHAKYVGHVIANDHGKHPQGDTFRPATTDTDTAFLLFWEVKDLHCIPSRAFPHITSSPRAPRLIKHP